MAHERGDVPGPTTKTAPPAENDAPPGTRAARPTPSSGAPLGFDEGTSEQPGPEPNPVPDKVYDPSEGESARRTPNRGGGFLALPGEDA
jgi:hypothetical protein